MQDYNYRYFSTNWNLNESYKSTTFVSDFYSLLSLSVLYKLVFKGFFFNVWNLVLLYDYMLTMCRAVYADRI